jgi:hypothetical protein
MFGYYEAKHPHIPKDGAVCRQNIWMTA